MHIEYMLLIINFFFQCISLAGKGNLAEIESNFFNNKLNSKTLYYGKLVKINT